MTITIENNLVFRDGAQIGTITGDNFESAESIASVVRGKINEAAGRKLTYSTTASEREPDAPLPPAAPTRGPEPKQDPRKGTKDPVWQAWKQGA